MTHYQTKSFWSVKIHQRLIKPAQPTKIYCPGCGRTLIEVNSNLIEISNDFGLPFEELKAFYHWQQIKHRCGDKIALLWIPDK